jgi:hypothetical protein
MSPEAAARERKQKIFVAAGGLFLVVVLVFFTLPKVLGGSSSSEAALTETTSAEPGQISTTPASTPTATPPGTTVPVAQPTTVAATTKLTSFSVFDSKDPFVQQVVTENGVEGAPATAASGDAAKGTKGEGATTEKFTTGGKTAAAATIVTVNGTRQVVQPGTRFPAGDPLFVLVAEKPGSKSIVIGIVGGAYSGGDRTTTLQVGKPVTLVNTTTGAKYKISLVAVGSGDTSEQPPAKQ